MSQKNYKDTVNLPRTDFPMKADLVAREPLRLEQWEASGLYGRIQEARREAPLFVLHDGPPFANGDVHMGTALNKILKDLIVKSKSMAGFRAPFVPGWDCHGLPIEFKVVKAAAGLGPLEIRRRSEEYARKFIDIQRGQFRRLGVLGDWDSPYLTLDPAYEAEVLRAFADLVARDLVYQSKKPVYWSTGAQTALAEAEVEYTRRIDPAIHVAFRAVTGPLAEWKGRFVIWTTTPWTLPANVAIAVHAKEEYLLIETTGPVPGNYLVARAMRERFLAETQLTEVRVLAEFRGSALVGSEAQHPFLDRTARVITAEFVTMDTGTGQVHIAPGHGADDYVAGQANRLPVLSPVDDRGCLTDECGVPSLTGRYVFDANEGVVALLGERHALLAEHPYDHEYPHCWRSKTPVVFRAVEQFFIRIEAIRSAALEAVDATGWLPRWGRNRIRGTVESRPDWCISRQRTWGVPLPAFEDPAGRLLLDSELIRKVANLVSVHGTNLWFDRDDAWWAGQLGLPAGTTRRNDTLDVWIDSGVSHRAVLRTHPALAWPADVYIEATDQHRGWFQSSLMTGVALDGAAPYRTVITHGFVVDRDGTKISKSSSYQKPMDAAHFVGRHGADLVRLWVTSVDYQNEVPFSEEAFTRLADVYRQFRNVLRILLGNLYDFPAGTDFSAGATTVDRWMLARLDEVTAACLEAYAEYDFRRVFQNLNQFVTVDLSALYIDITKDRLYCDAPGSARRRATQAVLSRVFDALCRLLAPILAFTADEAWEFAGHAGSVHLELFPAVGDAARDGAALGTVAAWLPLRAVVAQAVEQSRQSKAIGKALEAEVILRIADPAVFAAVAGRETEFAEFCILSGLRVEQGPETTVVLGRSAHARCGRCWRHLSSVGSHTADPELCDRCAEVVIE